MNSTFSAGPARREIQSDLFYDYRTNVGALPEMARVDAGEATAAAGDLG